MCHVSCTDAVDQPSSRKRGEVQVTSHGLSQCLVGFEGLLQARARGRRIFERLVKRASVGRGNFEYLVVVHQADRAVARRQDHERRKPVAGKGSDLGNEGLSV